MIAEAQLPLILIEKYVRNVRSDLIIDQLLDKPRRRGRGQNSNLTNKIWQFDGNVSLSESLSLLETTREGDYSIVKDIKSDCIDLTFSVDPYLLDVSSSCQFVSGLSHVNFNSEVETIAKQFQW